MLPCLAQRTQFRLENVKERAHLMDAGLDARMLLNCILQNLDMRMQIAFILLRTDTNINMLINFE